MRFTSLCAGVSLLLLGSIVQLNAQTRPVVVDQSGRQLPGGRAPIIMEQGGCCRPGPVERRCMPECAPRKKCRKAKWNFDFGFCFARPMVYCPPPRTHTEIVYVTPPPPPPPPAPMVCYKTVTVPSRCSVDRSVRDLKLTSNESNGEHIRLDGRYANLESIDIEVDGPSLRFELDGQFPALVTVHVDADAGDVRAKLRGRYPELDQISFSSRSGAIDLDLTGRWKHDCTVDIESTSGDIHLRLPNDIGVVVNIDGLCDRKISGRYNCRGDSRDSRQYVNAHYGRRDVTLTINIESMEGRVIID